MGILGVQIIAHMIIARVLIQVLGAARLDRTGFRGLRFRGLGVRGLGFRNLGVQASQAGCKRV